MRRIILGSCALASAAVLLAACGGKPWSQAVQSASPSARLLAAVQETTAAHTADFAMTVKMTASVPGVDAQKVTLSGSGAMDFTKQNAEMTMRTSAGGQDVQIEMRVLGGKIYVSENGEWTEASASGLSAGSGSVSASSGDPTQYMQYLNGVSSDVHVVGKEIVDDVQTTNYAGTIDIEKLAASPALSQQQRERLRTGLASGDAHIAPMPFNAWLDDQGRLRRFNLAMDIMAATATVHMEMSISYSNFGAAVNVQPPPGFSNDNTTTTAPSVQDRAADRAIQSDLRMGLTAEKVEFTDNEAYSASVDEMATIEGSLDWGGTLHFGVSSDKQSVCLSEKSRSGTTFSIADVATGQDAGTYFGTGACPSPVTAGKLAGMNSDSWDAAAGGADNPDSVQSDLRNAMTAEKTIYTDAQAYTAESGQLRDLDRTLAWGTKVHVYVADAINSGDKNVVCMWELDTASGKIFSIADVAAGPDAGTFFGTTPCPPKVTPAALSSDSFNTGW
jgi:hypothetical protein